MSGESMRGKGRKKETKIKRRLTWMKVKGCKAKGKETKTTSKSDHISLVYEGRKEEEKEREGKREGSRIVG